MSDTDPICAVCKLELSYVAHFDDTLYNFHEFVSKASVLRIGDMLYGFCNGFFGRDSYGDKRVEAIGSDWVVARDERGRAEFAYPVDNVDYLSRFRNPEPDDEPVVTPY